MAESLVERLIKEIELGVEDAKGDFPDVNPDDVYWEIMNSVLAGHSMAVHNAVRTRLGFDRLEVRR